MARKKRSPKTKLEMQEIVLTYQFTASDVNTVKYIDFAQSLSAVSRKLFRQGYIYEIESITAVNPNAPQTGFIGAALPSNWVTRNAWTKAFALWQQMNFKVLKDNPSVKGKWQDFKCFFDTAHYAGGFTSAGPDLNMLPVDMDLTKIQGGEWYMSRFVLPQPDVDPSTGKPLAADEFHVHMLGADSGGPIGTNPVNSGGIIEMYQNTRAQQSDGPTVPAAMSESWGTQLTDDGSQEPELADIIEAANDVPPYDADLYPGAAGNFDGGNIVSALYVNGNFNQKDMSFNHRLPLGLMKCYVSQVAAAAGEVAGLTLIVKLRPGRHHGVLCHDMSQSGNVSRLFHDLKGGHGRMS